MPQSFSAKPRRRSPGGCLIFPLRACGSLRLMTGRRLPQLRDWVTANRDALELFRNASERPDATVHPALNRDDRHFILDIGDLVLLAFFEASRLEQQGEMAEAWNWYRAIFRVKLHVMRRGSIFQRWVVDRKCSSLPHANRGVGCGPAHQ